MYIRMQQIHDKMFKILYEKKKACVLIACYPLHIRKHSSVPLLEKAFLKYRLLGTNQSSLSVITCYAPYLLLDFLCTGKQFPSS